MQTKINDKLAIQNFRRTLSGVTLQKWKEILCVIRNLTLTHNTGQITWRWENNKQISVRSLYKFLNFRWLNV